MNLGSLKQIMIQSAKRRLDRHKSMGENSSLSIFQVAELLDIVSGNSELTTLSPGTQFEQAFSLN